MIKKILLIILIISINTTYWYEDINPISKKWFNGFSQKIDKKYNDKSEILYFKKFNSKLNELILDKKFNVQQIKIIKDIIILSNEYIFNKKNNQSEKYNKNILNNNILLNWFKYISYNPEHIFIENWIWYTYKFNSHLKFPAWTNIRIEDLAYNWIKYDETLIFLREDNLIWFVLDYSKERLIDDSIINWIPDKFNLLKEIKNDKKNINYNTDEYFKLLKERTLELTNWKTKEEKIKIIYNYILDNIQYSQPIDLSDDKIFSWIDTFKNNDWVCEWYVKMFLYMLNFTYIDDSEAIRWYVIDAQDFPKVWHAWLRIWNKYYDPTFDDPIWWKTTKEFSEYKYFWLPYDLFYTNRYDFNKITDSLKEKDLLYRENLIIQNTIPLVEKYKDSWYILLKPYILKLKNWIDYEQSINIDDLKKIINYYEVENWKFIKNWKSVTISWEFNYYNISNSSIEWLLKNLEYDFNWYYLFKWKLNDWNYEYRLAYNIKTN